MRSRSERLLELVLDVAFANILRDQEPELYRLLVELIGRGQTPRQILKQIDPQLQGVELLPDLIEGTLRYLRREWKETR